MHVMPLDPDMTQSNWTDPGSVAAARPGPLTARLKGLSRNYGFGPWAEPLMAARERLWATQSRSSRFQIA